METNEEKEAEDGLGLDLDPDYEAGLTLEQKFDSLAMSLIVNAWEIIKKVRKKGSTIDAQDEYRQNESLKQFKIISGVYATLKKNGRIANNNPNPKFDEELLKKIKAKKGTIGEIVRDIPKV